MPYRVVSPRPLTAVNFLPYGEVVEAPRVNGFSRFGAAFANHRAGAKPTLSMMRVAPHKEAILTVRAMERHEHSSQTFIPMGEFRWLVLAAPFDSSGTRPDVTLAEAFLPAPGQGITFNADTWHHALCVLDTSGTFAAFIWREGTAADEQLVEVPPFLVQTGVEPSVAVTTSGEIV